MARALILADLICSPDIDEWGSREAQKELKKLLEIVQGVPVALGSGKSGLKYKLNGLAHSERLQTTSWKQVAKHINATFSWVGDLGEKTIIRVQTNLRRMFGDWLDQEFMVEGSAAAENAAAEDSVC